MKPRMRWAWLLLGVLALAPAAFAAMELRTDNRSLSFGLMGLGEEKTLSDSGSYHNEIFCASSGGRTWYLKVGVLQPLSSGPDEIPLERFGWQLASVDGTGNGAGPGEIQPFDVVPALVYVSGTDENDGRPVRLRFRYHLSLPEVQVSGSYHTTIRFTLTEVP